MDKENRNNKNLDNETLGNGKLLNESLHDENLNNENMDNEDIDQLSLANLNSDYCTIIEDLLELYHEGLLSPESQKFVEDHLPECPKCQEKLKALADLSEPEIEIDKKPLTYLKQELKKDRRWSALAAVSALGLALVLLFSFLTWPRYFSYSEDLCEVFKSDDTYAVVFSPEVSRLTSHKSLDPDKGRTIHWVSASTSRLGQLRGKDQKLALSIPKEEFIFYDGPDVDMAVDLVSPGRETNVMVLPRLALNAYFKLAGLVFIVFLAIALLFRPKLSTALKMLALPASYLLGTILIHGISATSHDMLRDFIYILLASAMIYFFFFSLIKLWERKRI